MAWKPEMLVEGTWCRNNLVFATKEEAAGNARSLRLRWLAVEACRAVEVDEPVNYSWIDGALVPVSTST